MHMSEPHNGTSESQSCHSVAEYLRAPNRLAIQRNNLGIDFCQLTKGIGVNSLGSENFSVPQVSIIIPSWNDAGSLVRTLDHLEGLAGIAVAEIIVAASGDNREVERAAAGRAKVLWPRQSTRAAHMNSGAAVARGDTLFFLHADSFPPINALELIHGTLSHGWVVGGAFEHLFAEPGWSLRAITWINRMRYRLSHNYYGDQGIFVRASVFRDLGGYKDLQILEDLEFSQRLKKLGKTVLVKVPMLTSGRRFLTHGPWRTFFFIVWLLLMHTLRLDTQRCADRWRGRGNRPPGSAASGVPTEQV